MKRRIKVDVPVEKRVFLGFKKTVYESRTIEVDAKTYKRIRRQNRNRPYSIEEMMFYDELFDDD